MLKPTPKQVERLAKYICDVVVHRRSQGTRLTEWDEIAELSQTRPCAEPNQRAFRDIARFHFHWMGAAGCLPSAVLYVLSIERAKP